MGDKSYISDLESKLYFIPGVELEICFIFIAQSFI